MSDQPADFDEAYAQFADTYAHDDETDWRALLNEQESQAFSIFLDTVLEDPTKARRHDVQGADSHGYALAVQQQQAYAARPAHQSQRVPQATAVAHSPFYKGFVEPPVAGSHFPTYNGAPMGASPLLQGAPVPGPADRAWMAMVGVDGVPVNSQSVDNRSAQAMAQAMLQPTPQALAMAQPPPQQRLSRAMTQPPRHYGAPGGAKSASPPDSKRREYLTMAQVRQNHINSEKRRRDYIKQQFTELCSLVPAAAKDEQLPKSVVLQMVYDQIVSLAEQNRSLRRVLVRSGVSAEHVPSFKLSQQP